MNVPVLRVGGRAVRFGIGKISDDGPGAAARDAPRLFSVAHEGGDVVPAAHERIEHRAADVSGRTREKDPHRGVSAYTSPAGLHHNSAVTRETLIDFFRD